MIVVEDRLRELISTMPAISVDNQDFLPYFDFGSKPDLDIFLKQEQKKYPLIWLETGFAEVHNTYEDSVDCSVSIKIATYGFDSTLLNHVRLNSTFKLVLFPMLENFRKALERSNIVLIQNTEFDIEKFYNYGRDEEQEQSEIWDAIRFDVDLKFNSDCLKPFNYG